MPDRPDQTPSPARGVRDLEGYEVPRPDAPIDVHLDGNLGPRTPESFLQRRDLPDPADLRSYPSTEAFVEAIASTFDLPARRILPTAGSNGALRRAATAFLDSSRSMVVPEPTFSLFPRFAAAAGASRRTVPWRRGDYPAEAVVEAADEATGLVVAVTPNNPNGLAASEGALREVAETTSGLLLVDHAYAEYADRDLSELAVERDDVVVTRTLSKAWGLAGLRVGFAVGAPQVLEKLDVVGNPYPVSAPSMALAVRWLRGRRSDIAAHVDRVRSHRRRLNDRLRTHGIRPTDSEANFVYAHFSHPQWIRDALAGMGFAVRAFDETGDKSDALRITVPGEAKTIDELTHALDTLFDPEALWLDLETVADGIEPPGGRAGESDDRLRALAGAVADRQVGLVSSRPRPATEEAVRALGIDHLVDGIAALDERLEDRQSQLGALATSLDVDRAWFPTAVPAWIRAARREGALPIGIRPARPSEAPADSLVASGAARTTDGWDEVGALLEQTSDRT